MDGENLYRGDALMSRLRLDHSLPAVLVLDGNQRSALAVVRSLGRRGVPVVVGEATARSLAGASRYCWRRIRYPSPLIDPEGFVTEVSRVVREYGMQVLPVTDITTAIVLKHRSLFGEQVLPFPAWEDYERLTNKCSLARHAGSLGVLTPATLCIQNRDELPAVVDQIRFPAVVKAAYSKVWVRDTWVATSVQYVYSREDLFAAVAQLPWHGQAPILIQQCVVGEGQGVFALFDHGRPLVWFAHRRVREKPPSGGVSVLSESISLPQQMLESARTLLTSVGWHGVAMVEFKVSQDGRPYLIEVNGRFWGSLQLAVDSGADFPYLLYRLAIGQQVEPVTEFSIGRKCRWLLGDLDRLYLIIKGKQAGGMTTKLKAVAEFLRFREPGMRYEVNRLDDMKPFLFELGNYIRAIAKFG